ncbi:MAG TPA: 16S rRNA (cytosine(1402)-N(4))-methyltransferase RsmH [Vicinamibacteria bacterium]
MASGSTSDRRAQSPDTAHRPVLVDEVLGYLAPVPSGVYVDATVGAGGHATAILEASSPSGRLIGIDRDEAALATSRKRLECFGDRVHLHHGTFAHLAEHLENDGSEAVNGIVADLGLSSMQLADGDRGFAFSAEGPLDMRFDRGSGETAAELIDRLSERELADLLFNLGGERKSRAIARRIVERRPIETTRDLRRAVHSVLGSGRRGGIDPATRTFQALRIAVNRELENLETFLEVATDKLAPGGRLVVISYHSLEDRAVKWAFREKSKSEMFRVLTRKPLRPREGEISANRRARSAKLRALERVS